MEQTSRHTAQNGSQPDLLSAIMKIQVRHEEKISEFDRSFCQEQQKLLYETLDQLDFYYDFFKKECEKYPEVWKVEFNPKGTVVHKEQYMKYESYPDSYDHLKFRPFESLNLLVKLKQKTVIAFATNIIRHFNTTYKIEAPVPDLDSNMEWDHRPAYQTYVDEVIDYLGGKTFKHMAEEEMIARFTKAAKQRGGSHYKPELKGDKIIFTCLLRYGSYSWDRDNRLEYDYVGYLSDICAGLMFGGSGSLHGGYKFIAGLDTDVVDFTRWYDFNTSNPLAVKFYKNGRVDVRFADPGAAAECFEKLRLSEF